MSANLPPGFQRLDDRMANCLVCGEDRVLTVASILRHVQTNVHRERMAQRNQTTGPVPMDILPAGPSVPVYAPPSPRSVSDVGDTGYHPNGSDLDSDTWSYVHADADAASNASSFEDSRPVSVSGSVDLDDLQLNLDHLNIHEDMDADVDMPWWDTAVDPRKHRYKWDLTPDNEWYPFGSKEMFVAMTLYCSKSFRLSDSQLRLISFLFKFCGITLPSVSTLKRKRIDIVRDMGLEPIKFEAVHNEGSYYTANMKEVIRKEFANPLVRDHLAEFPAVTGGACVEFEDALKWRKQLPAPMVKVRDQSYFVNDYVSINGIPYRIIEFYTKPCTDDPHSIREANLQVYARCMRIIRACDLRNVFHDGYLEDMENCYFVDRRDGRTEIRIEEIEGLVYFALGNAHVLFVEGPRSEGALGVLSGEILQDGGIRLFGPGDADMVTSHLLREHADGQRIVVVPIVLFSDDASGSRSKKWNAHENWMFQFAGLPFRLRQSSFHVHMLSTSDRLSGIMTADAIVRHINDEMGDGFVVWDSKYGEFVLVMVKVLCLTADNPMHSTLISHIGLKGRCFCRFCNIDVPEKQLGELAKVNMYMRKGRPRQWNETMQTVVDFLQRSVGRRAGIRSLQTTTGIRDAFCRPLIESLQRWAFEIRRTPAEMQAKLEDMEPIELLVNPLFRLPGFDGHMDTPVEVLHTVLLGFIKYFLRHCVALMGKARFEDNMSKKIVAALIDCLDQTCFYRKITGKSIIKYVGSLVGRDFRDIPAVAPFIFRNVQLGSVEDHGRMMDVWERLAEMTACIYERHIDNMTDYIGKLENLIDRFLASVALLNPAWFKKRKFHVLLHLPEGVRRFGPPVLYATENFERENQVFRAAAMHSNRRSPSRDIAFATAANTAIRHIVTGGLLPTSNRGHVGAGAGVMSAMQSPLFRRLIGVYDMEDADVEEDVGGPIEGFFQPAATLAAQYGYRRHLNPDAKVQRFKWVYCSGDVKVRVGMFAMLRVSNYQRMSTLHIGRLDEVLLINGRPAATFRLLEVVELDEQLKHPIGWPRLRLTDRRVMVESLGNIVGPVNVQHDCFHGRCCVQGRHGEIPVMGIPGNQVVCHTNNCRFLLNIYCIKTSYVRQMFPYAHVAVDKAEVAVMSMGRYAALDISDGEED